MQNIQLLVNTHWVEISQIDYLIPVTTTFGSDETRKNGMCTICVKESWDKKWHMGTSALMNYYTEFDFSTKRVSFTPLSSGTKLDVVEDV